MKKIFGYLMLCFSDSELRFNLGVLLGMILNILYITFNFVLGILYGNVWLITVAAYYMLIVVLRYMLINEVAEDKYTSRLVSMLLSFVAIPMTGIIVYTVLTDYQGLMPRRVFPILVFYAVISLVRAVFALFVSREERRHRRSMHLVRLSLAFLSLFNFQVAYLGYLPIENTDKIIINFTTGAAVTISVLALSVYLSRN